MNIVTDWIGGSKKWILASALMIIGVGLIAYWNALEIGFWTDDYEFLETAGRLDWQNYLAAYLAFSTFFFCRGFKLRWHGFRGFKLPYSPFRWWVTLPFIAVMLYATQTSTAVIALGAGAFVYWFVLLKRGVITRKAFWGTSAAGLAVVIWYAFFYHSIIRPIGNQGGDLQRLDMWISVWQDMTSSWQHFVFGLKHSLPQFAVSPAVSCRQFV